MEAVASGKISAETHLLKEKEEHLKEIEVLKNQVDRNQEVTRFAMENLRLKEEIRRQVLSASTIFLCTTIFFSSTLKELTIEFRIIWNHFKYKKYA